MNEIIKRQTAQEICDHRDEALRLLEEGIELIRESYRQIEKATSKTGGYWINHELERLDLSVRENGEYHRDTMENARKRLDAEVWKSLWLRTGLGDNFDTQAREEFNKQLAENPMPVTIENIVATCLNVAGMQSEIFERSVYNLFKRLSRSHKSNSGFCFGQRFVFWNVVHGFSGGWRDVIRDLERVVLIISGVAVPDRMNGVNRLFDGALKEARKEVDWPEKTSGKFEDEHFDFRWFKNGNLHVRIKSKEVIDQLNRIIADENVLGENPK